jgi:hypothetical protein
MTQVNTSDKKNNILISILNIAYIKLNSKISLLKFLSQNN